MARTDEERMAHETTAISEGDGLKLTVAALKARNGGFSNWNLIGLQSSLLFAGKLRGAICTQNQGTTPLVPFSMSSI